MALREGADIRSNNLEEGIYLKVEGIPDLYIPKELVKFAQGKTMVLRGDTVEFE